MIKEALARSWAWRHLSYKRKLEIKKWYYKLDKKIVDMFFSYNADTFAAALRKLGVVAGDTLLVHGSFKMNNGFKGNAHDIIECLLQAIGPNGNLLMVSLPYNSSSYEYLMKQPTFDVRRTPSMMGMISEMFRRKSGVLRSMSPTHPVLAYGEKSAWIVEGHEYCVYPCGKGSPFEKLRTLNGKVLFFDVAFPFTFFHYIEDLIKDTLPIPLYTEEPITTKVVNYEGETITVKSFVYPKRIYSTRRTTMLEDRLIKERMLEKMRIGRSTLKLVKVEDAIRCTYQMLKEKVEFYPEPRS